MMVPGSNLLNAALRVIAPQVVQYYAFTGRTTNANGYDVSTYAAPVNLAGSLQAVQRELYEKMGLDFQVNYVNFYISRNTLDVARDVSGDQIVYAGRKYNCLSRTPWFAQDGWDAILCAEVPNG